MCVVKIHAFTSIGRPPSWSGTIITKNISVSWSLKQMSTIITFFSSKNANISENKTRSVFEHVSYKANTIKKTFQILKAWHPEDAVLPVWGRWWEFKTSSYFNPLTRGHDYILHSANQRSVTATSLCQQRSQLLHSANLRSWLFHSANQRSWQSHSAIRGCGYFTLTNRWSCLVSLLFQTEVTFFFLSANRRLSHVDNLKISLYAIPVPISAPAILALSAPGLSRCQLSQSENAPVPAQPIMWSVCTDRIFQLGKYSALYFLIQ